METPFLPEREYELIRAVFARHPEVVRVILFGSRAKKTNRPESDIDLALEGGLDALAAERIASELDELPLPYRFDVVAHTAIQSADLLDHIRRVGVVVYERG